MPSDGNLKTFDQIVAEERSILRAQTAGAAGDTSPLSALCISGGGIRSATFGLGAIQGLAEKGILTGFDYLSTVSGGGYIGAWLTSWKHRAGGLPEIVPKLRAGAPLPDPDEVDPIGHLREYNNYLSPRLGFFSADTWTLAATVIRNMALNWLVLIPLLMFALMAPRLILALWLLKDNFQLFYGAAMPGVLAYPVAIVSGLCFAAAIFNTMRYLPGVGGRNRTETVFLKYCLAPIVFAALGFMTYDAWFDPALGEPGSPPTYLDLLLWITASCAAGWLAYLAFCVRGIMPRLRMLCGPLSLAIMLTGVSTATAAWLLVTEVGDFYNWLTYTTLGPPLLLLSFMAAGGLFVGLTSRVLGDDAREWLSRGAAWMLLFVVCWAGICGLVLMAPAWVFGLQAWAESAIAAAGGLAGWLCSVAGFGSQYVLGRETGQPESGKKAIRMGVVAKVAALVFVAILLVGLAILTNWLMAAVGAAPAEWTGPAFMQSTRPESIVAGALAFLAVSWIAAHYININKFSLHAMYRNRLIRAYLGASNRAPADPFTGFTKSDNILMADLKPELKPFHVVNMTLNLVAGKRLAWQQRKAESFTVSPLHSGSARLSYRPTREYGGRGGMSLGTAITISGAAASPSMGYHSSGVIGFIMTLFNARLGAWLGNPGKAGQSTWRKEGPSSAVNSLVREAFGLTDDTSAYVDLSDGGHFENLGLYEMVMRRCGRIVVLDSGCDPRFIYEDLGNALRKIRIDMRIPIDFDDVSLKLLRDGKQRWAFATIRYSAAYTGVDDGLLIYVKPMILGNEPPDVATYRASHPEFPHQSTGNQWYDESQTESYRMLGLHTIQEMCAGWNASLGNTGLPGLFASLTSPKAKAVAGSS
jgi:Patatin-like phospholipase